MEDGRWKMEDGKWKMENGRETVGKQFILHPCYHAIMLFSLMRKI
jgi:hypothetical protein